MGLDVCLLLVGIYNIICVANCIKNHGCSIISIYNMEIGCLVLGIASFVDGIYGRLRASI